MNCRGAVLVLGLVGAGLPVPARGQEPVAVRGDSVTVRLVDVELRLVVQMLSQYLDRPVLFGSLGSQLVTIETPRPVAREQILPLLRSMLENQNHELVDDSVGGVWRVRSREQAQQAEQPRQSAAPELFVIRLTHARAADVAGTVNALYGRASALGERDGSPETLGEQLRQNLVPPGLQDASPRFKGRSPSSLTRAPIAS
jgi:type II secretory pathway component GspD/PulD (secretin)